MASSLTRLFSYPEIAWRWYPDPDFDKYVTAEVEDLGEDDMRRKAARGGKTELREIIKMGNDALLLEALDNPSFDLELVITMLERRRAGPTVLAVLGQREHFSRHSQVAMLMCRDPKTPYYVTKNLIHRLPFGEIKDLARSASVSPQLQKDAKRIVQAKERKRG